MDLDFNSLLALSFGAWSAVVGLGTRAIIKRMDSIAAKMEREAEKLNRYVIQTEARLAVLENGRGRPPNLEK